jgi:hypothetical protein
MQRSIPFWSSGEPDSRVVPVQEQDPRIWTLRDATEVCGRNFPSLVFDVSNRRGHEPLVRIDQSASSSGIRVGPGRYVKWLQVKYKLLSESC